jgi:hypothetical protein
MHNLKGQMGGFGTNLPFCLLLMPLSMEVDFYTGMYLIFKLFSSIFGFCFFDV